MYTTSFRVVQLMYKSLRGFSQSVPFLVIDVQTCHLDHYTLYSVGNAHVKFQGNAHIKFQGCTVDDQTATGFLTIST